MNRKLSDVQITEIVTKYTSNNSISSIKLATEYCVSDVCIRNCLKKRGIEVRDKRKLTKEQTSDMLLDYQKDSLLTSVNLGEKYGISPTSIRAALRRNNIKIRPKREYFFNEQFFDKIDTPEKAYILGMFYADGNNDVKNNVLRLKLQQSDIDILYKIAKAIGYTGPIAIYEESKRFKTHQNHAILSLCSKHLSQAASKVGCGPKKSLVLKFPSLNIMPENLRKHFILGYYDGDGWITFANPKGTNKWIQQMGIISTRHFCLAIKRIYEDLGVSSGIYKQGKMWTIVVTKKSDVLRVAEWLYDQAPMCLDRKKQIYLNNKDNLKYQNA